MTRHIRTYRVTPVYGASRPYMMPRHARIWRVTSVPAECDLQMDVGRVVLSARDVVEEGRHDDVEGGDDEGGEVLVDETTEADGHLTAAQQLAPKTTAIECYNFITFVLPEKLLDFF